MWVRNPFWLDENGAKNAAPTPERVWSGSFANGTVFTPEQNCAGWMSALGTVTGTVAFTDFTLNWTQANAHNCDVATRLDCMADNLRRRVPLPSITTERRAFLSNGTVDADQGVAAMDALCQTEATSASLPHEQVQSARRAG